MILRPVLDCSMAMSWCFEDEKNTLSDEAFQAVTDSGAVVPSLFFLEVTNSFVVAERRRRLSTSQTSEFLEMLFALDLSVLDESIQERLPELLGLSRRHQLSVYDAMYLDLAKEIGAPLASLDGPLCAAATHEGVALFTPKAN